MTIKWFKPPFNCVIFPLTQPQVANQQKKKNNQEQTNFVKLLNENKNKVAILVEQLCPSKWSTI